MTQIHVTRVSGADAYGHETSHCDEVGCNGTEYYFPGIAGSEVVRGDIVYLTVSPPAAATIRRGHPASP